MNQDGAKKAAGEFALRYVKEGMTIGLGTGSTAAFFIEALGKKMQSGFSIRAIATSEKSVRLASQFSIPLVDPLSISSLDLAIDGADEIDPDKNMIKGGGGALLREKITATMSKRFIVIVDQKKCVDHLGAFPLPLEVIPYGVQGTIQRLQDKGFEGKLRQQDSTHYITDSGNFIFDIENLTNITHPKQLHFELLSTVGVVETGLFFDLADTVIIGNEDGTCKIVE